MAKLELSLLVGADSKAFLASLTNQIDRLEKLATKKTAAKEEEDEPAAPEVDEADEDEEPAPAKKKKADFDDEEEEGLTVGESDDEEEDEPAPKKAKPKKVTIDEVNDAAKALARSIGGKEGRTKVLAILKKKFKTESISELKPDDYAACIAALKV